MDTKKILGLDLGVTSIGWAIIQENEKKQNRNILGMGVRIIPLSTDDSNEFSSGNAISKNAKRRQKRMQRRGYDRYQQRRLKLSSWLKDHAMTPDDEQMKLGPLALWNLRSIAAKQPISKTALGRVLYHLNQKRGYKGTRAEESSSDKQETEYVAEVKNRHQLIREAGKTIGQWHSDRLDEASKGGKAYRIKGQVFPREAYLEEFDTIMAIQAPAHQLEHNSVIELRNRIIYYQRPLKSQKKLVSTCEFEGEYRQVRNGQTSFTGPKVAPRSSPLFQTCKILESIQNIRITNRRNEIRPISIEEKKALFDFLNKNRSLSEKKLFHILNIDTKHGWYGNKLTAKGIQGNITYAEFSAILGEDHPLLTFSLKTVEGQTTAFLYKQDTGEVIAEEKNNWIDRSFQQEPMYTLWHTVYSIKDKAECQKALRTKFGLNEVQAEQLARLDFSKFGFGNKSASAMRKIIPYMVKGYDYSAACSLAGYNHSNSFTKEEILKRQLKEFLPQIKKNSLRQPVVEKILNQMTAVVNAIIREWGRPDEIRVELARELKQSKDERNQAYSENKKREKEAKSIIERIEKEYGPFGVKATRRNILKWRLFHEISNEESKINAICLYCGKPFGITDAMRGSAIDVDHIIPRSLLFDDSQSNKILVHRHCNQHKDNETAFDYMSGKGEQEINRYIAQVDELFTNRIISYNKKNKLMMPSSKIPQNFIDRQLRETQYITRKAKEILEQVCYHVWTTSGSVTNHLRHNWGWDDILMNLQLPKYRELGMTEWKVIEEGNGMAKNIEVIPGWTKRDDHRHHAIDALTVACTRQGFIQRLNTLSSSKTRDAMREEIGERFNAKKNLLDNYLQLNRPFTTTQVQEKSATILVSYKPGKKVTTSGKNRNGYKLQENITVPRGSLSEESVYGKINKLERVEVKDLFTRKDDIVKDRIRKLVEQRIDQCKGDEKKAQQSVKKQPIYLDENGTTELRFASCYKQAVVIKYPLNSINSIKQAESIVDKKIRDLVTERLQAFKGQEKKAFAVSLYADADQTQEIRSVRCYTGLDAVVPLYSGTHHAFVKPGNNHHVAIYRDSEGNYLEHLCTFMHAVDRKKQGLPPVIENTNQMWDQIKNGEGLPDCFVELLPPPNLELFLSLQQGESFVVGLTTAELTEAVRTKNYSQISDYCYRVQKLSSMYYVLRHHLETKIDDSSNALQAKRFLRFQSIKSIIQANPIKISITNLGHINYD